MASVQGFLHPKTVTGRSSLIPSPPWHYSGDLLTVEYRTDPARVAELLPAPLAPAPDDPGAVAIIWADWQSCSESAEELLDPIRAQYKECFVVVRCSFDLGGETATSCVTPSLSLPCNGVIECFLTRWRHSLEASGQASERASGDFRGETVRWLHEARRLLHEEAAIEDVDVR